jgi:plasmid stabilization system protein ParE
MMHRVIISIRAEREIQESALWWATNRSAEQASRWLHGLDQKLQSLAEAPTRWPLAAENGQFAYELRELHFGIGRHPTHRAVFTIAEDLVLVLTVRHTAQDELRPEDL